MNQNAANFRLTVIAMCSMFFSTQVVTRASEDPPTKKATAEDSKPCIEFKEKVPIGKGNDDKATASYTVLIKLSGSDSDVKFTFKAGGRCATGNLCSLMLEGQLREPGNCVPSPWKYTAAGSKLFIEGWNDPKTKKYYPVRSIRFESADFDKKYWPTITGCSDDTSE